MAKFGIGESVRFRAPELLVSTGGYSLKIGTDGLVGKVTCSVETTGEETKYCIEVKLPRSLSASVSCILGISRSSDVTLKLSVLESKLQSEKEYSDSKFDELIKRTISSFDPYSWVRDFFGGSVCAAKESVDRYVDVSNLFADLIKRWKERPRRYDVSIDFGSRPDVIIRSSKEVFDNIRKADRFRSSVKPIYSFFFSDFAFPMTKDIIEEYEKKFNENARYIMKGVNSAVPGGDMNGVSVVDGKMSKSRCVKLLESYRAEREKVKNGRKFERCLRDSVVDEALERAIELLSEKS